MFNRYSYRILAAYIFAIPLALILGFLATSPDEITFMLIGMLLFFLALPLFINWHHALLIIFWNSAFSAFFLPGQLPFWLLFAGLSFGISVLGHVMGRRSFISPPEMTRPLLFLAAVVLVTACYRGGIGIKILASAAHGGKYYIYILGAIMGYFALTAGQVPMAKSGRITGLYFASGTTYALCNLAYTLGPGFFFLFYLVPAVFAHSQAASDFGLTSIDRITGLSETSTALLCFLLVRYGVRGLFEWNKPWRFLFLCLAVGAGFFAGFRSVVVLLFLIFAFQFCFEGLVRISPTRLLPILLGLAVFGFVCVLLFASRMPLSVQRTVSFLPVNVDASVRADAISSTEWRFRMWAVVWKEVPRYLIVGKGYSFDPAEMELTTDAIQMGILESFEEAMLAGDYHSGPLSVIVPFGIAGVVAFLWVLIAGFRILYSNFRYGDERLRRVNSVLLSYYLAYVVLFFFIFGALSSQLFIFLGAVGMSVSLNGGVRRKPLTAADRARLSLPQAYAMEIS